MNRRKRAASNQKFDAGSGIRTHERLPDRLLKRSQLLGHCAFDLARRRGDAKSYPRLESYKRQVAVPSNRGVFHKDILPLSRRSFTKTEVLMDLHQENGNHGTGRF